MNTNIKSKIINFNIINLKPVFLFWNLLHIKHFINSKRLNKVLRCSALSLVMPSNKLLYRTALESFISGIVFNQNDVNAEKFMVLHSM